MSFDRNSKDYITVAKYHLGFPGQFEKDKILHKSKIILL